MNILLRSHDVYAEKSWFDTQRGTLNKLSAKELLLNKNVAIRGKYTNATPKCMLMFRDESLLLIYYGNERATVNSSCYVRLVKQAESNRFQLLCDENLLIDFTYAIPIPVVAIGNDLTPMAEPEHFDFVEFVANCINDPIRQQRIFNLNLLD